MRSIIESHIDFKKYGINWKKDMERFVEISDEKYDGRGARHPVLFHAKYARCFFLLVGQRSHGFQSQAILGKSHTNLSINKLCKYLRVQKCDAASWTKPLAKECHDCLFEIVLKHPIEGNFSLFQFIWGTTPLDLSDQKFAIYGEKQWQIAVTLTRKPYNSTVAKLCNTMMMDNRATMDEDSRLHLAKLQCDSAELQDQQEKTRNGEIEFSSLSGFSNFKQTFCHLMMKDPGEHGLLCGLGPGTDELTEMDAFIVYHGILTHRHHLVPHADISYMAVDEDMVKPEIGGEIVRCMKNKGSMVKFFMEPGEREVMEKCLRAVLNLRGVF